MDKCRLILDGASSAFRNMAVDESLFECAAGSPVSATLRLYGWSPAAVSLGRRQKWQEIDVGACRELGLDAVRRISGGGAVYHHDEITYSFVARTDCEPFTDSQKWRRVFCGLLKKLGVEADKADKADAANLYKGKAIKSAGTNCFSYANEDEPTINGLKWVGSARRKNRKGFMQHGSILLKAQPKILGDFLGGRESDGSVGLMEIDPGLDFYGIRGALVDSVKDVFGFPFIEGEFSEKELELAEKFEAEKINEWDSAKAGELSACRNAS
ncbi:MAG: biotin/lipoate A/B protein ligase family protein [Nitrospinota bacterium]